MKELLHIFDILKTDTTGGVLASLVRVEGSSYRRVGARLLWRPTGARVGSISGGCLEEDLVERAREVHLSGKPDVVVYDTTSENDLVWGVGLGCHGIVHVLLEPVSGLPLPFAIVRDAWKRREGAVLGSAFGDAPSGRGCFYSAAASGPVWPARSDTPEAWAALGKQVLVSQHSHYTRSGAEAGSFPILWEYLPPPLRVVIFGAGDDAMPLVRLAKEIGWEVVIADPRAAYATVDRFPAANEVHVLSPEQTASLRWDPLCVAVVMSHHYRFDLPTLRAVLPLGLPYLGVLGPKKRSDKMLDELAKEGLQLSPESRDRLHAPVGLDLGGGSPEEVALAIVAEIQAVMARREARPLRNRTRPIHG